jgi:hypothetical protein
MKVSRATIPMPCLAASLSTRPLMIGNIEIDTQIIRSLEDVLSALSPEAGE